MRNIQKQSEPISLTQHRCQSNADYDNYADKDDLRKSLVVEQKGICCYCMQRIRPTSQEMKIEHCLCQDNYEEKQLDYQNLLGACLGNEGKPKREQHCDTRKGNSNISFNPSNPVDNIESKIKYLGDGTIKSDEPQINQEINDTLNLNQSLLKKNRKAVLDGLKVFMDQSPPTGKIRKKLQEWNGDHDTELKEYCQVAVYYLRKKLNQRK
jgi:uncharacterized protein (TIGR02646 family)